jgi:lipid-A-disaccharide synthase
VLAGLSSLSDSYYDPFSELENVKIIKDEPYPLMAHADVAIVASGTATLETAYLGTPLVVIYKIASVSYLIGKLLVDIEHIAMPNLIIGERAVTELIQNEARGQTIADEVLKLLTDPSVKSEMLEKLDMLKDLLGRPGCAKIIATEIERDLD